MSAPKHTPGPWVFESYLENEGNGTFELHRIMNAKSRACIVDEIPEAADAERIVACVNACEGVSTEKIAASPPLKELIAAYEEEPRLRLRYAEAIEALREFTTLVAKEPGLPLAQGKTPADLSNALVLADAIVARAAAPAAAPAPITPDTNCGMTGEQSEYASLSQRYAEAIETMKRAVDRFGVTAHNFSTYQRQSWGEMREAIALSEGRAGPPWYGAEAPSIPKDTNCGMTGENHDPALAYQFKACSDPECNSCHAYYCLPCGEKLEAVQYAKSFGRPEQPLTLSWLESECKAGDEVKCETCRKLIYGESLSAGFAP